MPELGYSLERADGIAKLEALRDSKVITLVTSVRPQVPAQMADDQVRMLYDHLLRLKGECEQGAFPLLDLYIVSNGGDGIIPWRIISVFREFAKKIGVLVPYKAYSAATLTALGADEIVMGPFAQLGPIDPTVQNDYNPVDERTGQRIGVSVEDVKSYIAFIKTTVGITHEDELIRAVEALLGKVHPLALGNVERFIAQSRMIARKLLHTHMSEDSDKHTIDEIIENMASKLYFHGHPINRVEARGDLKLKVAEVPTSELEDELWALYLKYEQLFEMTDIFNPAGELAKLRVGGEAARRGDFNVAYANALQSGAQPLQAHQIAQQLVRDKHGPFAYDATVVAAVIESIALSSIFTMEQHFELMPDNAAGQPVMRHETLSMGWANYDRP